MKIKRWTEQEQEAVRDQWNAGVSAAGIASHLGVTRSSVMGLIGRMRAAGAPLRGKDVAVKRAIKVRSVPKAPPVEPMPVEPMPEGEPESLGVSLLDLAPGHCRFPTHFEDGQHFFCGQDRGSGTLYCAFHQALAKAGPS